METVEIVCPDCGKKLAKISTDSKATLVLWCRRCRQEKVIKYNRAKEPNTRRV